MGAIMRTKHALFHIPGISPTSRAKVSDRSEAMSMV